jgi:hypothetical protein
LDIGGGVLKWLLSHFCSWRPATTNRGSGRLIQTRPVGSNAPLVWRDSDNPNELFVMVEFASVDDARTFRERLLASGALDRSTVKAGPTVIEHIESVTY